MTEQGGKAGGYYEPSSDEIHILRGKDAEFRALLHEKIHASRRDKLTFKLAEVIQTPTMTHMLTGIMLVLAVLAVFGSWIPFFFMASLFLFLLSCHAYEEYVADVTVQKSMKEIKLNRGENQK
jgi:hypothetical protein